MVADVIQRMGVVCLELRKSHLVQGKAECEIKLVPGPQRHGQLNITAFWSQ